MIQMWREHMGDGATVESMIGALAKLGESTTGIREMIVKSCHINYTVDKTSVQILPNGPITQDQQVTEEVPLLNRSPQNPVPEAHGSNTVEDPGPIHETTTEPATTSKESCSVFLGKPIKSVEKNPRYSICMNVFLMCLVLTLVITITIPKSPKLTSSVTYQVGGWGMKQSSEVKELHRPATPECQNNKVTITDLPRPLRSHVALDVTDLGLLVCGGKSEEDKDPGRNCFVFTYETGNWDEYHSLNVGRLGSYMKQIENKIYIIGGSSPDPFTPCLSSVEVLDLDLDNGWHLEEGQEGQEGLCSQVGEVVVELKCM